MAMAALDAYGMKERGKFSKKFSVLMPVLVFLHTMGVKAIAPNKAVLKNLASIPLTLVGVGFIDYAAFYLGHGWGWLVLGISLIILESVIAEEQE